ncbi:MAG: hypothetical protein SWH61_04840 [Thermodesulfobacteriota bacterium]|nr:hypothetical protein [Thermodesulfobacteriota bacterium]
MHYYEIINEDGGNEGTEILAMFYGNLWESALDRLNHGCDGMLLTLSLDGRKYFIYRRMKS